MWLIYSMNKATIFLILTSLIVSGHSFAGAKTPGISGISGGAPYISRDVTIFKEHLPLVMDGYQEDWFDINEEGVWSTKVNDLGIELYTVLSERISKSSFTGNSPTSIFRRYYFLKVKKSNSFRLKDAQIITSYKNSKDEYRTSNGSKSLRTIKLDQTETAFCDNVAIEKQTVWTRYDDGSNADLQCTAFHLGGKTEREGAFREDNEYLYFEFYTLEPYWADADKNYPIPVVTLLASNDRVQAQSYSAICSPSCPNPEDWYGKSKASVQIGISVQIPLISGQVSFVSDLKSGIYPSASLGSAITNRDVELEGFIVFYNTDDLDKIVNGTSYTYTHDVGRILGAGLIGVVNTELDIYGVGATIGLIGVPDSDIAVSYGFEPNPDTIPDKAVDSESGGQDGSETNGDSVHNPNFGGTGDDKSGNDRNSGHAGGTSENSDGGVGVNTPWGGR